MIVLFYTQKYRLININYITIFKCVCIKLNFNHQQSTYKFQVGIYQNNIGQINVNSWYYISLYKVTL